MILQYFAATEQFDRDNNEDFFFADDANKLYIVADGMGGAKGGEVASKFVSILAGKVIRIFDSLTDKGPDETILPGEKRLAYDYENALKHAYFEAHEETRSEGFKKDLYDMGCTVVMAIFRNGRIYIMNAGDCRGYQISEGKLRQITRDHSLVEQMVREGKISPDEAKTHPKRSKVTRWIGGSKFSGMPDTYSIPYYINDRLILCTDGVHKILQDDQIEEYSKEQNIRTGVANIMEVIKINSAKKRDNATVMIIEVVSAAKQTAAKKDPEKTAKFRTSK